MGATWILVLILADGGVEIDELENEDAALAAYERAITRDYLDVYLAPVRCEAHREHGGAPADAGPAAHHVAVDFARPVTWNTIRQVLEERRRQDAQWGGEQHDDEHTRREWTELLAEHVDRSRRVKTDREGWRARVVVVAALALAALESYDRGGRSSL